MYGHDSASRLATTTYFDASGSAVETISTTYDKDSKVTGMSMAGTGYSSSAANDNLDRAVASTSTGPAGTVKASSTYDIANLVTNSTWQALGVTRSTEITYAKTGELAKMTVHDGASTETSTTWYFAFDVGGKLTRAASGLSSHLTSFDPAGRLSALRLGRAEGTAVGDWASQRLTYDLWERVASVSTDFATGTDAADTFEYDDAGRIQSWGRTGFGSGEAAYEFDVAGNLTSKTRGTATTSYTYNAGNQLTTETVGSIETTHGYDEFGRLVRSASPSSVTTYTWDPLGHLSQVASEGAVATYEYGISGMREAKTVVSAEGTRTIKSVWAGMQLVAELDSDGTRYEYVYGGGMPLELVVTTPGTGGTTERYAYQLDAGGSVIGITDEAGDEVARYAYDPYGVPTGVSGSGPVAQRNPLRFRGYYFDTETGMYYLPARYYGPGSARFLSVDPAPPKAGDPVSINRYSYCFGDPVNNTDSTGAFMDWDADGELDAVDYTAQAYVDDPTDEHLAATTAANGAKRATGSSASASVAAKVAVAQLTLYLAAGLGLDFAVKAAANYGIANYGILGRDYISTPTPLVAAPILELNVNGPGGFREMGSSLAAMPPSASTLLLGARGGAIVSGVVGAWMVGAGIAVCLGSEVLIPFTGGVSLAGNAAGAALIVGGVHWLAISGLEIFAAKKAYDAGV